MTRRDRSAHILILTLIGCLYGFAPAMAAMGGTVQNNDPISTELYSILSSPSSFDGKLVDVSGFICLSTNNSALLFSYRYCEASEGQVGVGLRVVPSPAKIREQYGHKSYGEVIGIVHTLKPNETWIDNGLGSVWIDVNRITAKTEPFVWSYDVTAPLSKSTTEYAKAMELTKTLLDSTRHKDYLKLARVFSPRNDEMMEAYEKDFQNSEKRLNWVFFSAPHSIYSALNASGDPSIAIEVYETKKPDVYLTCTSIGLHTESFQPGIDFLLRGGDKFCFTIFHEDLISDSAFEYE